MKKKMKGLSKAIVSLFLVLIMLLSTLVANAAFVDLAGSGWFLEDEARIFFDASAWYIGSDTFPEAVYFAAWWDDNNNDRRNAVKMNRVANTSIYYIESADFTNTSTTLGSEVYVRFFSASSTTWNNDVSYNNIVSNKGGDNYYVSGALKPTDSNLRKGHTYYFRVSGKANAAALYQDKHYSDKSNNLDTAGNIWKSNQKASVYTNDSGSYAYVGASNTTKGGKVKVGSRTYNGWNSVGDFGYSNSTGSSTYSQYNTSAKSTQVTMEVVETFAGYNFEGWYNSSGTQLSSSTTYTFYNSDMNSSTNDVQARFSYNPYFVTSGESSLTSNSWMPGDPAGLMALSSGTTYTKTFSNVAAGTYQFRITDGTTVNDYVTGSSNTAVSGNAGAALDGNNVKFTLHSAKDVTITFDSTLDGSNKYPVTVNVSNPINWPPINISGYTTAENDKIVYINSDASNSITNGSTLNVNSDGSGHIWVDFSELLPLSPDYDYFFFGLSNNGTYSGFYAANDSTVTTTDADSPGVSGCLQNEQSKYYFAGIWGSNGNHLKDLKRLGCLITKGDNNKFDYKIYTDSSPDYDPFYIGGRFVESDSNYTGAYAGDFNIHDTKFRFTEGANNIWTCETNATIAQLSRAYANSSNTAMNQQFFLIHDKVDDYAVSTGGRAGNNFELHRGSENAITLKPVPNLASDPNASSKELEFDDIESVSDGKVTLYIDATNYDQGNSTSQLRIWYDLRSETPSAAHRMSFRASPSSTTVGKDVILTAQISELDEAVDHPQTDLQFLFEEKVNGNWTTIDTLTGDDITNPSTGVYRAAKTVNKDSAGSHEYRVTVQTTGNYDGTKILRAISKETTAKWTPPTVYYTSDITADATSPTWADIDPSTNLGVITTTLAAGIPYTIALSDEAAYNLDFQRFRVASEYNQYCDVKISSKMVPIGDKSRAVTTYVITPRTNCANPTIYIDAAKGTIYAKATYLGDTKEKTSESPETVTYYFAERSDNMALSNPNGISYSNNEGMRIHYWNNSVTSNDGDVNITKKVKVKNSNAIHVDTSILYNNEDNTTEDATFYVYSVELPIWATSFQFLNGDNGTISAYPIYTKDYTSNDHSITLNPNRIYLLYQDGSKTKVQGVILDESMWSATATRTTAGFSGNEVRTKNFTANVVNYTDITSLDNPDNGVNTGLKTAYNSSYYNTPHGLYFGYFSSNQSSWANFKHADNVAQSNTGDSYYSSIQDLVGARLTSLSATATTDTDKLNANGFGMMLDTRNDSTNGILNSNLMPLFDYEALANNSDVATTVKQGLHFPFYQSEFNGITTYSYDSTTDRNRVYDPTTEDFAIQGDKDSESGYRDYYAYGHDSDNKGYVGYFPFGGNKDKYSNTGFSTEFDLNFYMTNSGSLIDADDNAHDIVFNFSGDDDVWVYVDGVKVLDLGGDHKVSAASINFTQGKVYYKSTANSTDNVSGLKEDWTTKNDYLNTVDLFDLFESNGVSFNPHDAATKHTFQMFYMERGAFQSNCVISFNLPQASGLSVYNSIQADNVNRGLQDAALQASNEDYFTYTVKNRIAYNSEIETWKNARTDFYKNALLPDDTVDWSAVSSTPLYPYRFDIIRSFMGEDLTLASSLDSRAPDAGSALGSLTSTYQALADNVYTLSDNYATSSSSDAKLSGITDTTSGVFHLLGGEKANFADKVRPNSYVQVYQTQEVGEAEEDTNNHNIIHYNEVSDNNAGNYYTTSYSIYDEAAKKDVVPETQFTYRFGDNDTYYAVDQSPEGARDGFYFTNYAGDASSVNPAMTVNFVNEIAVGTVQVGKEVPNDTKASDQFFYKVEFQQIFGDSEDFNSWAEYDFDYMVYNIDDDTPVSGTLQSYGTGGYGYIVLKPGQYAKIEGVPVETRYKVTEVQNAGYKLKNINKTCTKPNGNELTKIAGYEDGFYNYLNQGGDSLTIKDDKTYTDSANYTYYCNMIPIVSESYDGTHYVSISNILYSNEKLDFTIEFKYYDRYRTNGATAGISSTSTSYSVTYESIPEEFKNYQTPGSPSSGLESIDFAGLIEASAVSFQENVLGIDNVMCDYKVWTSQEDAAEAVAALKYFNANGTPTSFTAEEAMYHTNYLGRPNTGIDKQPWVTYYNTENQAIAETDINSPSAYHSIQTITVWCYNSPRMYDVHIYGADDVSDLDTTAKTVNGCEVYVVDSTHTNKRFDKGNAVYYNQRIGEPMYNESIDSAGFISNYGLPGIYTDPNTGAYLKPADYAANSFTNDNDVYKFAYWAYDPSGTSIASVDINFMYRISADTKLYAVYSKSEAGVPAGISISANENDHYVKEDANGGTPMTRLNILASVYGVEPYSKDLTKLSFVRINFGNEIRNHPEIYTPAKINELFDKYKDQLKTLITAKAQLASTVFDDTSTYSASGEVALTLTSKGYIYTVTSNGNDAGGSDRTIQLTNKNRAQYTVSYKTSALKSTQGNTCLMYCAAMEYQHEWTVSTNCLLYYNGEAIKDNNADTWSA